MANRFIKGLFKDTSPGDQPQGTWRYAKNMTVHPMDGAISAEKGISVVPTMSYKDDNNSDVDGLVDGGLTTGVNDANNWYGGEVFSNIPDLVSLEPWLAQVVIGAVEITDDRVILFTVYDTELAQTWLEAGAMPGVADNMNDLAIFLGPEGGANPVWKFEIGEWDGISYTRLYRPQINDIVLPPIFEGGDPFINAAPITDQDLNFSKHHFIEGTYKKNPDGELFVYWTDDLNPPRVMNITRQKEWLKSADFNDAIPPVERLYGIDPYTTTNPYHKDMLNLFPASGPVPHVEFSGVEPGGGLKTGTYYLALAYVDRDLVQTNFVVISNPISVVEDTEGVLPIERYDGAPPGSSSGKAVAWNISNLNTDYEYVRPAVIRKSNGVNDVFKLGDIPVQNLLSNDKIVFTGLEGYSKFAVADVIVDTISYDSAKTLNQLDGSLYLGNLKGTKDLGYQKYANHIKLCPELKSFDLFDPHEVTLDVLEHGYLSTSPYGWDMPPSDNPIQNGYRWNDNIFKFKGYTRDEVYAIYIAFIMRDGSESYAYHIPGRGPLKITATEKPRIHPITGESIPGDFLYESIPTYQADPDLFADAIANEAYESWETSNPGLQKMTDNNGRLFHFYETSMMDGANNMNFWQNFSETYPEDELNRGNWEVWDAAKEVLNPDTYVGEGQDTWLQGKRVRHHHFPSNESYEGGEFGDGFQVFGNNTSDVEGDNTREWFAVDFGWCRSTFVTDWQSDGFGNADAGFEEVRDEFDNETDGVDADEVISNMPSNIVMFKDIGPSPANGVWPAVGQIVSMAYVKDGNKRRCGSYKPMEQYPTGGAYGVPGTINEEDAPDSWTDENAQSWCTNNENYLVGKGELFAQGGFGSANVSTSKDCDESVSNQARNRHFNCGCIMQNRWHQDQANGKWGCVFNQNMVEWSNNCDTECVTNSDVTVLWSNDTGTDNVIIVSMGWLSEEANASMFPQVHQNDFSDEDCQGFLWWPQTSGELKGALQQNVRALGFSLHDLKIPQDIAEKTQGFRIYYAKREHNDRRILGQNIFHPYVPTPRQAFSSCLGAAAMGLDTEDEADLNTGFYGDDDYSGVREQEQFWLNWPYTLNAANYGTVFENRDSEATEYQAFSFHDFYLMRSRNTIAPATHIKIDYLVNMLAYVGPGIGRICSNTDGFNASESEDTFGYENCWMNCLETGTVTSGYHIAFDYVNPTAAASAPWNGNNMGGTNGQTLYNFFNSTGFGDINRPLKERCKNYIQGDTLFNGKQLGFGFKSYNEFGESHIKLMLNERWGFVPPLDPVGGGGENEEPNWIRHGVLANYVPVMGTSDATSGVRPVMYQGNLHAFRLDMYNSIDTQDLVWTGFEVVGKDYQRFWAHNKDVVENAKYDTKVVLGNNKGKIFGGDTFIARHGYRKTLRPNVEVQEGNPPGMLMHRDYRFLYENIVESTDNINFRHVENITNSYFPGSPMKEVLRLDNLVDLTHFDNMKYNEDYSAVNDIGHTVPLPLQIIQPTDFPTRVIRSARSDDSTLVDNYRSFLALQLKDLPKNRGDLWKISVFNNLLYFHMEDSIYRTKGKQTLELADKSQAFIGSGDLFAQEPEELVQTEVGYAGNQSQFASVATRYGYFFLDQRNRKVFMITDKINEISSLGMEKWFTKNIPYVIERYGAKPPRDNPYTFGFHATWDEKYQRILLTKRELIPTKYFVDGLRIPEDQNGALKFNKSDNHFYRHAVDEDEDINVWEKLPYSYLSFSAINQGDVGERGKYFEPGGWSISYQPELGFWVSFHDDSSYKYMTLGNRLFSFIDFAPLYTQTGKLFFDAAGALVDQSYADSLSQGNLTFESQTPTVWLGRFIWEFNDSENTTSFERFKYPYTNEVEVIHNEGPDINKLFYNFSYDVDIRHNQPHNQWSNVNNPYAEVYSETAVDVTETYGHGPGGWSHFVVWNSFQNSGERELSYLQNLRRNGSDWCVSRFRDRLRSNTNAIVGGSYVNPAYTLAQTELPLNTVSSVVENMWNIYGMNEVLNSYLQNSIEGGKFIDKWIAIRLICKKRVKSLNLLSTKVGIRKYPRHEQNTQPQK